MAATRSVPGSVLSLLVLLQLIVSCILPGAEAATFNIVNKCPYVVYVGSQPNAIKGGGYYPVLENGGFGLPANGASKVVTAPADWQGRFWGRTGCKFDTTTKKGTCETGDCGGSVYCQGNGGAPPATLAEILLGVGTASDFYDISLVDGYNLPMSIAPRGGTGKCTSSSCPMSRDSFLSNPAVCDATLQVRNSAGQVIACNSGCTAFHTPQYCCTKPNDSPSTCPATQYSQKFKMACPQAYSYAFDDLTSTFTCKASTYDITFCP